MAVPQGRLHQSPARYRHHGHPGVHRHPRSSRLVDLRAVLGHRRRDRHDAPLRIHHRPNRWHRQHLSRGRCRGHHLHPRRPVFRGSRQTPRRRRTARLARPRRQGSLDSPGRSRTTHPGRSAHRRRRVRSPPRREDRHRRCRRRRLFRSGCSHDHRRIRPGGSRSGRPGRRCHRQRGRTNPRARHPRGIRHAARPDGPARRGRPNGEGPGPAAGRQNFRDLRRS